jgi:hypothetical protein
VFKVYGQNQAPPAGTAGGVSFNIHNALPKGLKYAFPQIRLHGPVYGAYSFPAAGIIQKYLRENKAQGRRAWTGLNFNLAPVVPVLGKLVAGDYRPGTEFYILPGNEYFGNVYGFRGKPFKYVHGSSENIPLGGQIQAAEPPLAAFCPGFVYYQPGCRISPMVYTILVAFRNPGSEQIVRGCSKTNRVLEQAHPYEIS